MQQIKQGLITAALSITTVALFSCSTMQGNGGGKHAIGQPAQPTPPAGAEAEPEAEAVEASAPAPAPKGMVVASMAFPTGDPASSAILVEKVAPAQVQVGQLFDYETRVTNVSALSLENVVITETTDANFILKASNPPSTSGEMGEMRWNIGDLSPSETRTITVAGTAKDEQSLGSCLSASYESALCTSISVVAPLLELVANGPTEVTSCDEIVYTYVVTNRGSGAAQDVIVQGTLPEGLLTEGRSSFVSRVGTLEAGLSSEIEVLVKATRSGSFLHTAEAGATGNLSAESGEVVTVVRTPKLEIAMTGPKTQFPGRVYGYEITVTNAGDGVASEAILEHALPAIATFESASEGGKYSAGRVRWSLGDLEPSAIRTFSVRVKATEIGQVSTRATAKAYCATDAVTMVETDVRGIPAVMLEVVDLDDPIEVGQNETYVITVTNQGTAPATNVKIKVQVPENAQFVNATGSTAVLGSATIGRSIVLAPVAQLAPDATASWQIVVKGLSAADARFKVSMTSDQLTSPVDETEATNFYE